MKPRAVAVKISRAMLLQRFHPCEQDFVRTVCGGRCCVRSAGGIMVTVHPSEQARFEAKGARIEAGFIQPDARGKCPFQTDDGMCSTHADKPFGCRASPFTLSPAGTLIVRNRYRMLKCFGCPGSVPAYRAHAWSLQQIFGQEEAARIARHLDEGWGDFSAWMPAEHYAMLRDNDRAKKGSP